MNSDLLNKILFSEDTPVSDVLERFNETSIFTEKRGFGLVVNEDAVLTGIVSDGDVRRGLLEGVSLKDPVAQLMNQPLESACSRSGRGA